MDEEAETRPQIPVGHYLSELKKAMESLTEMFEGTDSQEQILVRIEKEAEQRRPWNYIQSALLNHDGDLKWLQKWCKQSQTLL